MSLGGEGSARGNNLPGVRGMELNKGSDTWFLNLMWQVPRLRGLVRWLAPDFSYQVRDRVDYEVPLSADARKRIAAQKLEQRRIADEYKSDPFADPDLVKRMSE